MSTTSPHRCRPPLPPESAAFRPGLFQQRLLGIIRRRVGTALLVPAGLLLLGAAIWAVGGGNLINNWPLPGTGAPAPQGMGFGLIAVGGLSVGFLAIGGGALGVIAWGGAAVGVIAWGGAAVGVIAIGGGAVGVFAFGGGAIGLWGAIGGGAFGLRAVGGGACGKWVLAGEGRGEHVVSLERQDEAAVLLWCELYPELREAFPSRWPDLPANRAFLAAASGGDGAR